MYARNLLVDVPKYGLVLIQQHHSTYTKNEGFKERFDADLNLYQVPLLKIFVCTVLPDTVLIRIEFKFIVPKLWQLVCRILPEGLNEKQKIKQIWQTC